ncbi:MULTISPECIES: NACHT domain-containing protein [Bacillus]|uniref:NACHT domain-containing protein n=2 Tax=Bacillaceae TaxID=186817 RepID=UPI0013D7D01B|nr:MULTISPECIES: NACHT domain-containing protein [Bacillus]
MEKTPIDPSAIIVDVVQKNLETIVKRVFDFSKGKVADYKIKTQNAYQEYLNRATERYGKVKTLIHKSVPINLYDFYVHTDLKCEDTIISAKDINNILHVSKYNMILGSGGSGKSTLFKHLFINALHTTNKIPILVPLRNVNDSEQSLTDCMYETISSLGFTLEKKYFIESLDTGIYIFLFDGFDEVEDNKQLKIIKEIEILMNKYYQNSFLVSSRRSDSLSIGWDRCVVFDMLSLSKEKAIQLIERLPYYDDEVKSRFLRTLDESLYRKHDDFCSNPLLLTLMLMTFDEFAEIPDKMHVFYGQAYDVLDRRHDATKPGFKRNKKTDAFNLGSDGFSKILEAISAFSYFEDKLSFSSQELTDYINNAKKIERLEFNSQYYTDDLIEAVCILYLEGLKYTYQHRSFQEYFTARYINRQPEERQKKLLYRLVNNKGHSISSDQVLNILWDLNRTMVERQLFIPRLSEIREQVITDGMIDYIVENTRFLMLRINKRRDGSFQLTSTMTAGTFSKLFPLLSFMRREYYKFLEYNQMFTELENRFGVRHWRKEVQSLDELYSFVNFFNFDERFNNKLKNSIEFFDQYKNEEKLTRQIGINVNLSMQYGCSEVKQEVLGMLKPIEFRIKTGLEILEKLEQEHQEMNLLLDDFF